ncbi:MAG: hypothetical protein JKY92_03190 [Magnetovibrio sp.]|nr:hypothetical protein [Magnetovibrio sp.]
MTLENLTMGQLEPETTSASKASPEMEPISFDEPRNASLLRRVVVKVRLLPMVIFFSTLMLTVRVGDIWTGVDGALNGTVTLTGSEAHAQTQAQTKGGATPGEAAMPTGNELGGGLAMDGNGSPAQDKAAAAARMLADDPTLLTQSEIDLLQKLAERRVVIDAREKELESRVILLAAAEARIDIKIKEFKGLQATIEALVTEYDKQQSVKLQSLVKIYQNMKPKDAARILEELDMDTLLPVVERMKDRSLAAIMAKMNPQRARDITVELRQLRQLPDVATLGR